MSSRLLFIVFLGLPFMSSGQFGIYGRYLVGKSDTLESRFDNQNGYQVSLEYNFRLKQKRIEFRPGIGYRTTFKDSQFDSYFSGIDLDLNTAVYPFDFAGDCHCPTFSKEGKLFKKGFFLEVSPGASLQTFSRESYGFVDPPPGPVKSKNIVWKLGGAAGLDIGFSDRITMTPLISFTMLTAEDWEGIQPDGTTGEISDQKYIGAGLRVTYHPDERRKRF